MPTDSDVSMSLFEIRYDYDTIITKNRDYRYDFRFFLKRNNHLNWAIVPIVPTVGASGGGAATGREDWTAVV